jgi:hypothetical protein
MDRIRFASTAVLLLLLGITAPICAQQQKGRDKQDRQRPQTQGKQQPRAQQQQKENRPLQQSRRLQRGEERAAWQQHRARSWQAEHKTWQQRGGYNGYRIPEDNFRGHFGQNHGFRIYSLPLMSWDGFLRFQYNGFWFSVVDPWPEYWPDNWYENDDVSIDYSGDGYYMYNRRYPRDRIAISVYVN